jgi:hypothetical protein
LDRADTESGWCGPISARAHLGQSHGAAGNWTKAGLISSFARAILGNEDSMDDCRPVFYMFDQADHCWQICAARVRATRVKSQILGQWKRKSTVRQIGLNDRPIGRSGLAPDGSDFKRRDFDFERRELIIDRQRCFWSLH